MKYVTHPAIYRMRNGRLAVVKRTRRYEWNTKDSRGAIVLLEGHQIDSADQLLMWATDGTRAPSYPRGQRHPQDLVRRVRAKEAPCRP